MPGPLAGAGGVRRARVQPSMAEADDPEPKRLLGFSELFLEHARARPLLVAL
jgi:hypothetical protein